MIRINKSKNTKRNFKYFRKRKIGKKVETIPGNTVNAEMIADPELLQENTEILL
jgi:hypothetical protein